MNAARAYAHTQKETASKEGLMVLLFQTALRHMRTGAAALEARQWSQASMPLSKATDIVAELLTTLDVSRAPELGAQLTSVYTFVADRLVRAAAGRDPRLAREAERAFAPLVDAFRGAVTSLERASAGK